MATNPQLSAAELAELVKLYKTISGYTEAQADAMARQAQQLGTARQQLEKLQQEYKDWTSDIDSSIESLKEITSEFNKFKTGIKDSQKAYSSLNSIAEKIQYHQKGINTLSSKELENLQKKAKQEQQRLTTSQTTLKNDQTSLLNEQVALEAIIRKKEILGQNAEKEYAKLIEIDKTLGDIGKAYLKNKELLDETNNVLGHVDETLKEEYKTQKQIEETMGVTGALMKGMSKIPFLGDLPGIANLTGEIEEDIRRINKEREKEGKEPISRAEALSMTFKKMGPIIKNSLSDPLLVIGFLVTQIVDAFKSIDEGAGKLAKDMNMSYSEAVKFRGELSQIATLSADNAINTKGLQESYTAIGQALGANADINEKDLVTFTKLREQAGYTNEELVSMQKLSLVTGKNVEDTAKEFLGGAKALSAQKGLAINVKQLMKETSNVSNAIKLSIKDGAKGLAEAAVKAKEFGINLEQADKIASSLLEFESSISAELEAELLTGKQLNLETARLAALNGDIGKVAEEINNQIGGSAEFTKMNRIQQEAYAKAVGMSREELANSLVEQEGLQKIGVQTAAQAKEKYDLLRKTMSAEEAAAALGDDELARQYEQQSVQERFTQAVEKLKDIFVTIAEGPLGTILSLIADLLSNSYLLYGAFGALAGLMAGKMLTGLMGMAKYMRLIRLQGLGATIMSIIKGAWDTFGAIPVVGAVLAGSAAVAGIAYAKSQEKSVPGLAVGGTVVGEGSVLVGENGPEVLSAQPGATVTPLSKVNAATESGQNITIDYDRLAAAMSKIQINNTLTVDKQVLANTVNSTNNTTSVQIQ